MDRMFILYQEHSYTYDAHALVPKQRKEASPTRVASFHPATVEELGKIHKHVMWGYRAWLVPAEDHTQNLNANQILQMCHIKIVGGIARKIA
jgi:hypothetical protein